jgi:hypothetical protein
MLAGTIVGPGAVCVLEGTTGNNISGIVTLEQVRFIRLTKCNFIFTCAM